MGLTTPVSNDTGASNAIKNYFNTLGQFLGIEPVNLESMIPSQNPSQSMVSQNSDTEDEDEPELIEAE